MAPSKDKTREEPKETLSPGDPDSAYVGPDLSGRTPSGDLPESEQDWHDDRDEAQQASAEAAAEHEDKVVKQRRADEEKAAKEAEKKDAPKPTTSTSGSTASSGSS